MSGLLRSCLRKRIVPLAYPTPSYSNSIKFISCQTNKHEAKSERFGWALNPRFYSKSSAAEATKEPVVGPGGPDDRIPSMYEQSAGLERLEYLANLAQKPIFLMDPLVVDHFGTLAHPIEVPSISGSRIVGCSGFPADSHETLWFKVEDDGKGPARCCECGQAFAIKYVNEELKHQHHEDHHQ